MKVITRMLEDEVYQAVTDGFIVTIDMREPPLKKNQGPVQLLLSSLTACGAVDIVQILRKRKKTIRDFVIEAEGVRMSEHPRGFISIHCKFIITSDDVTEDELQKTARLSLEKYCSVAASLKSEISFSVQVIKSSNANHH